MDPKIMFKLREKGHPLTDLDRYFQRNFEPLQRANKGDIVTGEAFIHPTYYGESYVASTYPILYKADTKTSLPEVHFRTTPPDIFKPTYLRIKAKKEVVPSLDQVRKGKFITSHYKLDVFEW